MFRSHHHRRFMAIEKQHPTFRNGTLEFNGEVIIADVTPEIKRAVERMYAYAFVSGMKYAKNHPDNCDNLASQVEQHHELVK